MQIIPGLTVIPDFVSVTGEAALVRFVDSNPWLGGMQRRVQHYGYVYDYKRRSVDPSMKLGNLPEWAAVIAQKMAEACWIDAVPDQMIVNEYVPGQGISPHIDCEPCFGDTVLSLSLGSGCLMDLIHVESGNNSRNGKYSKYSKYDKKVSVELPRRSLLVMRDEARYEWQHGIAARKTDVINGRKVPRNRRLSLTFRQVVLTAVS